MEALYWHCAKCGNHEAAQPGYKHGDHEPCCLCADGVARVMTLKEAARVEQQAALAGKPVANPIGHIESKVGS